MQSQYTEKTFELDGIKGLSERQVTEHLKLYAGYVKNANKLAADIAALQKDENNAIVVSELRRRFGFEWNGMRLHEYYFEGLGEPKAMSGEGDLKKAIESQWGGFDNWASGFKKAGMMRGIGWVILFYDPQSRNLFNCWITDHEMGHLAGLPVLLAMDVWEHAYILDYLPSQRKEYIETFFASTRWNVIEDRFGRHL